MADETAYSDFTSPEFPKTTGKVPWIGIPPQNLCTYDTCDLTYAYFAYRPTFSANLAFTILFGISTLAFLVQGLLRRKWLGFTIAMVSGCALEVIGYTGRVIAYNNLWKEIVCLTIAPAFLAAGIYLCLSRIVTAIGPESSRISPKSYPRIFIACDFLSLVLQAAGGGIASVATHQKRPAKTGNNIMIAGLSVQVVTMLIFILLALDFAFRSFRRRGTSHGHATLRNSRSLKLFLVALSLSTLCIFTRCVFRVAELSKGWSGHLMKTEKYFIGLEGAVIVVAVFLLNFFHPGFCFPAELHVESEKSVSKKTWYGRRRNKVESQESSSEELRH